MNLNPLLWLAVIPALAVAQDQIQPRDPILNQAAARAEWTVRITEEFPDSWAASDAWEAQETTNAAPTRTIRSISYAKDAELRTYQVTTRWTSGETEEEWIVMETHVAERPGGGGLYAVGAERLLAQELKAMDFPELAWLERKHFVGIRTYKGKKVFAFEEEFNRKRMTPTEARQYAFARQADPKANPEQVFKPRFSKVIAYLDVATQLPVLFNDGRKLHRYAFKAPDAGRLRPPQAIIDFVRNREHILGARTSSPAGPGVADPPTK